MLTKGDTSFTWDIENRLEKVNISTGGQPIELTLELDEGWNLISLPFRLIDIGGTYELIEDVTINQILQPIEGKYDQVSKYDTQTSEWKHFVNHSKFDQFSNFEYGEGYLVYINQPCSLTLNGISASSENNRQLYTGWNLTAALTDYTINVEDQFEGLSITSAKSYNGSGYDDVTTLEKSKAYWVHLDTDNTWTMQITSQETTYQYDGDGSRTKRIANDKTTSYVGNIYEIEEVDDDRKTIKQVYLGNNRLCSIELTYEDGATSPTDSNVYFNHSDHIGSSNFVTDQLGQEVQNYQYTPYGEVASYNETGYNTDKRFAGKTYDESTRSLINFGARMYDYELGRFISPDPTIQKPYDPQTYARYSYARSNPIRWVDVDGFGFWSWLKSFFKGFLFAIGTVLLTPVLGNPVAAAAVSGAITGAVFGAIEGGLEGALKGAAQGFIIGGIIGTLGAIDPSGTLLTAAFIGGAVEAGVTGGGEGLANFAAGALGAASGYYAGNALVGQPTVKQSVARNSKADQIIKNAGPVKKADWQAFSDSLRANGKVSPPLRPIVAAETIAFAAQNGTAGSGNSKTVVDNFYLEVGFGFAQVDTIKVVNNRVNVMSYKEGYVALRIDYSKPAGFRLSPTIGVNSGDIIGDIYNAFTGKTDVNEGCCDTFSDIVGEMLNLPEWLHFRFGVTRN